MMHKTVPHHHHHQNAIYPAQIFNDILMKIEKENNHEMNFGVKLFILNIIKLSLIIVRYHLYQL